MPLGFSDALVFLVNLRSPSTSRRRRRPRLPRPIKISAPIPHDFLNFNVNAVSSMNDNHSRPESPGVFYLVSDNPGTGKSIVRRPAPPAPSSPLEGNFDNLPPISSDSRGALRISRPRKRPSIVIRTSPPPVVRKLDSASLRPKRTWLEPMRALRNSFRRKPRAPTGNGIAGHSKGKQKEVEVPVEDQEVFEEEQERDLEPNTSKDQEIRAWIMGKSTADIQRSATYPLRKQDAPHSKSDHKKTRHASEGQNLLGAQASAAGKERRGPRPGQTYEMVHRQVIEKNSDKTVELSTWREQNGKEVNKEDADRISVYYITASELEEQEATEKVKVEWRFEETNKIPNLPPEPSVVPRNSRRISADEVKRRHSEAANRNMAPSSRRHGTISLSTSEKENSSPIERRVGPRRRSSNAGLIPRSKPYVQSTPVEKELPPFPFRATRSGSTISTIKSQTSLQLAAILESCEPSLLHIMPVLQKLGVRKVEHLRAVARLTPGTRDREVKEDALKLGITIIEWAIFVDKIFTL